MKAETHLLEGHPAPEVKGQKQDGAWKTLSDYKGKPLVSFFYGQPDPVRRAQSKDQIQR